MSIQRLAGEVRPYSGAGREVVVGGGGRLRTEKVHSNDNKGFCVGFCLFFFLTNIFLRKILTV